MSRRTATLALMVTAAALILGAPESGARPLVVWNATASAPLGFYRIEPATALHVGDLVLLRPDPASAALFAERGYLPRGVPLLKPIAALSGMRVCEQGGRVSINGVTIATALSVDSRGRRLHPWQGCHVLGTGEVFVLNPAVPASLDGRYFGSSPVHAVLGRAMLLWTWRAR